MNAQFHKNFPFGKGLWIWEIWTCVGKSDTSQITLVDLQNLANDCKNKGLTHVYVKCGDGKNTWAQWTPELIKAFHDVGLKVYSWNYVYGDDPLREAAIANWALDMGADGHVFDAESEYQGKSASAKSMLEAVRQHAPDAFLAYAPFPIIDYHQSYPYLEFGKYCDAVLPQIYFGDFKKSPIEAINWTAQQFLKWQQIWQSNGFGDSVKPIIPLGQAYDAANVGYVQKGQDITDFINASKGYLSVSFWSYQHIYKQEVWDALKNNNVDTLPAPEPAISQPEKAQPDSQNATPPVSDTPASQPPVSSENTEAAKPDISQEQPQTPTPELPNGGTGYGTGEKPAEEPAKPEENTKIWGINSSNSIHYKPGKKKHIDYVRDFIIFLLKSLHLI